MTEHGAREIDTGTAYAMPARAYRTELVEVGRGSPMGELMRRYWQPVALTEDLTDDQPRKLRILGEELVLFRDKQGRPGLVHEHCCHRGTSLFYGRIEDDGIRCCYHGWKFDVEGRCLEQPAEVGGGQNRQRLRQPWYPVEERYGLVYAYMGPPEKKPVLPRWAHLEDLADDEYIEACLPPVGRMDQPPYNTQDFNWLQSYENTMDGPHVPWLHYYHTGDQFTGALLRIGDDQSELPPYAQIKDMAASIVAERSRLGIKQGLIMHIPGMGDFLARNEAMVPNMAHVSTLIDLLYFVPLDDTHFVTFALYRSKKGQRRGDFREMHGDKTWWELTEEEHQTSPGDYEAQSSIGSLPAHNQEHLSPGDVAIVMLRRRLEEAVKDVAEGRDPPGVSFDPAAPPVQIEAHGMLPYKAAS